MVMTTNYTHIVYDEHGVLRVASTWHKVIMLIGEHVHEGSSPTDLIAAHPALTLGAAYEVLAYYYDHKEALDAELTSRAQEAEHLRAELEDPRFTATMRARFAAWQPLHGHDIPNVHR